jgi:hypothetical protein
MANITRGFTFNSNQSVTPDNFNDLVDDATLTNVANAALATGLVFPRDARPLSPNDGDVRVIATGQDFGGRWEIYDGSAWNTITKSPSPSTTIFCATTMTGPGWTDAASIIGPAAERINPGAVGQFVVWGLADVLVQGSVDQAIFPGAPIGGRSFVFPSFAHTGFICTDTMDQTNVGAPGGDVTRGSYCGVVLETVPQASSFFDETLIQCFVRRG